MSFCVRDGLQIVNTQEEDEEEVRWATCFHLLQLRASKHWLNTSMNNGVLFIHPGFIYRGVFWFKQDGPTLTATPFLVWAEVVS